MRLVIIAIISVIAFGCAASASNGDVLQALAAIKAEIKTAITGNQVGMGNVRDCGSGNNFAITGGGIATLYGLQHLLSARARRKLEKRVAKLEPSTTPPS